MWTCIRMQYTGTWIKLPTEFRSKSNVFLIEPRRTPGFEWASINRYKSIRISSFFVLLSTDEQSQHEKWNFEIKRDGGCYKYVFIYHCTIMIDFIQNFTWFSDLPKNSTHRRYCERSVSEFCREPDNSGFYPRKSKLDPPISRKLTKSAWLSISGNPEIGDFPMISLWGTKNIEKIIFAVAKIIFSMF